MPEGINVRVVGMEDLLKKLKNMDKSVKKDLKKATKAGGKVIQADAKSRAPGPEIAIEVTKATQGFVEVAIGPVKEKWYYRFFETGARAHEITPDEGKVLYLPGVGREFYQSAQNTGGVAADPFLRPAFDGKKDEAIEELRKVLWAALQELIR